LPAHAEDSEKSVESLLKEHGLKCCPEPDWITEGKKPDFFCTGRAEIWVEVKSLGQTYSEKLDEQIYSWFEKRREIDRPGAEVSAAYAANVKEPDVTEQDVKEAISRVRRILNRSDLCDYQNLLLTIPKKPDFTTDIEFTVYRGEKKFLIVSARDKAGCYGAPYLRWEFDLEDKVEVRENGSCRECTAKDLGLDGEDVKLGVHVRPWNLHEISLSGWIEIGDAKVGLPDRERLLDDAKGAGKKIRNALKYKCAPSIVFFVSENDTPGSCAMRAGSLKAILYGVPRIVWSPEKPDDVFAFHGEDAFWQEKTNTSVSAACYLSNGNPVCVIHNPFAKYPFPEGLLDCPKY